MSALPRLAAAAAVLAVSACATADMQEPLPWVKYATAGSYMDARTAFTAPPSEQIFQLAVQNWTNAVADSAGCRFSPAEVSQAGMVAAVELAAMSAFAKAGDRGANLSDMGRFAADMALAAAADDRRPSRGRCQQLARWLPEVNRQGDAAVRRAMINGLRRGLFGSQP